MPLPSAPPNTPTRHTTLTFEEPRTETLMLQTGDTVTVSGEGTHRIYSDGKELPDLKIIIDRTRHGQAPVENGGDDKRSRAQRVMEFASLFFQFSGPT